MAFFLNFVIIIEIIFSAFNKYNVVETVILVRSNSLTNWENHDQLTGVKSCPSVTHITLYLTQDGHK